MKKVIIQSGINIEKGQWNADFTAMSRRDSNNEIFATDKARKYSIRQELLLNNENILIRKHEIGNGVVKSLINILKDEAGISLGKKKEKEEMKILFDKYLDLRLFGYILNPSSEFNFNSNGAFQIYYANNINKNETFDIISDITSYKPSSNDKDGNSTIGKHIVVDQGFLNYSMVIQPSVYRKEYQKVNEQKATESEIEEQFNKDYNSFLNAINSDVSNLNSCTKNGVYNLYNLVITMKDETSSIDLYNLKNIKCEKQGEKTIIDFSASIEVIKNHKDKIDNVVLYVENNSNIDILNINDEMKNNSIKFEIKNLF